jgi:Secretion system C-terminal sorting domain
MKITVLTVASFLLSFATKAQQLTPIVVNTAGGSFITPTAKLACNIGEVAITKIAGTNNSITQGFLQPKKSGASLAQEELIFQVFPNPTQDLLFVAGGNGIENYNIEILDAQGRLLLSQKLNNEGVSMQEMKTGIYHIRIQKNGATLHTQLITKL